MKITLTTVVAQLLGERVHVFPIRKISPQIKEDHFYLHLLKTFQANLILKTLTLAILLRIKSHIVLQEEMIIKKTRICITITTIIMFLQVV